MMRQFKQLHVNEKSISRFCLFNNNMLNNISITFLTINKNSVYQKLFFAENVPNCSAIAPKTGSTVLHIKCKHIVHYTELELVSNSTRRAIMLISTCIHTHTHRDGKPTTTSQSANQNNHCLRCAALPICHRTDAVHRAVYKSFANARARIAST